MCQRSVPRVGRLRARRVDARRGLGLQQMHALQHLLVLRAPLAGRQPECGRPMKINYRPCPTLGSAAPACPAACSPLAAEKLGLGRALRRRRLCRGAQHHAAGTAEVATHACECARAAVRNSIPLAEQQSRRRLRRRAEGRALHAASLRRPLRAFEHQAARSAGAARRSGTHAPLTEGSAVPPQLPRSECCASFAHCEWPRRKLDGRAVCAGRCLCASNGEGIVCGAGSGGGAILDHTWGFGWV